MADSYVQRLSDETFAGLRAVPVENAIAKLKRLGYKVRLYADPIVPIDGQVNPELQVMRNDEWVTVAEVCEDEVFVSDIRDFLCV